MAASKQEVEYRMVPNFYGKDQLLFLPKNRKFFCFQDFEFQVGFQVEIQLESICLPKLDSNEFSAQTVFTISATRNNLKETVSKRFRLENCLVCRLGCPVGIWQARKAQQASAFPK